MTDLTSSWAGHFGFSYDDLSRRTQLAKPNGISTNYAYDSVSRLLSVLHQAGTTTVDGASYTNDNAGNRTAKQNLLTGVTENYSYDPIYQLTQVLQGANTTEAYTYDDVGNRLSDVSSSGWQYNSSNQLTSTPSVTNTFDQNGNTLTKADSSGTTQYSWDIENRLTSVTLPGGGGTVSFKYDPFGRRIQKTTSSGTTNYVYDGANFIAEYDAAGALLAKYAQGAGIDEPLAISRGGQVGYYDADGLGSITSVIDNTLTPLATYTYDAFGKRVTTGGSLVNPFQYTGREWDQETGLYYYRARYYDAQIGRFISADPIGFSGGVNSYAYVANDPTDALDPRGLSANSERCRRLREKIENVRQRIQKRLGELDEDPKTLPESCPGDDAKPSLSRNGHRRLINMDKALLATLEGYYVAYCSDPPAPAVPVTIPAPAPDESPKPATTVDLTMWLATHPDVVVDMITALSHAVTPTPHAPPTNSNSSSYAPMGSSSWWMYSFAP